LDALLGLCSGLGEALTIPLDHSFSLKLFHHILLRLPGNQQIGP
jgi:hypothetical protein